jgi:hypothetical protein
MRMDGYNSVMNSIRAESWNFNGSVENEARLKPLCQQVEARFNLPSRRLPCYSVSRRKAARAFAATIAFCLKTSALQAGGRRFESCTAHHLNQSPTEFTV